MGNTSYFTYLSAYIKNYFAKTTEELKNDNLSMCLKISHSISDISIY